MKIAVIDKKDMTLKLENKTIKYETQSIPFRTIDMLILNHRTTLHSKDILTLTKENISILLVGHNNYHFSLITSANSKASQMKEKQYKALSKRVTLAKYFLSEKFTLHQEQLAHNGISFSIEEPLAQLQKATTIETLMGIEGALAKAYFQHYFSLIPQKYHKHKRSKQPPLDPVNALLSYWYSLYYHLITLKLLSVGLDPSMGYLHRAFRTHHALSSDILELFRATINQAVQNLFLEEILTLSDFSKKGGVYLRYEGRKKVWKHYVALVHLLQPKLNEVIAKLKKELNDETV